MDDTTNGTFVVNNNTIVNFVYGLYYDGDDTDPVMSLSLGGAGLGNTFRGNTINMYLRDLRTNGKTQVTATDWGTTDSDEIMGRIYIYDVYTSTDLSSSEALLPSDALIFDESFTSSAPDTLYIDDDYSAGNAESHTYGVDAFSTISEGLAYVANGGIVEVANGQYYAPIWIDRSVSLIGTGDDVFLNPMPGDTDGDSRMINVTGEDVTIDNIIINGGNYGVYIDDYSFEKYLSSKLIPSSSITWSSGSSD